MLSLIKTTLYLFYFILFFCSCQHEKKLPLPEDKLVPVLMDIHIAEAGLTHLTGTVKDSTAAKYYQQIYTMHGVEEAVVDSCLYYLKRHPARMKKVYDKVTKELEKMKTQKK
ncbi:MAG TPA: DUF4296 domain-containing protein [Bacteroidetes bacterium]|nr:DUF4296 domain-containing protein [Bacteroidota bacterium]